MMVGNNAPGGFLPTCLEGWRLEDDPGDMHDGVWIKDDDGKTEQRFAWPEGSRHKSGCSRCQNGIFCSNRYMIPTTLPPGCEVRDCPWKPVGEKCGCLTVEDEQKCTRQNGSFGGGGHHLGPCFCNGNKEVCGTCYGEGVLYTYKRQLMSGWDFLINTNGKVPLNWRETWGNIKDFSFNVFGSDVKRCHACNGAGANARSANEPSKDDHSEEDDARRRRLMLR